MKIEEQKIIINCDTSNAVKTINELTQAMIRLNKVAPKWWNILYWIKLITIR